MTDKDQKMIQAVYYKLRHEIELLSDEYTTYQIVSGVGSLLSVLAVNAMKNPKDGRDFVLENIANIMDQLIKSHEENQE